MNKLSVGTIVIFERMFNNDFMILNVPRQKGKFLGRIVRDNYYSNLLFEADVLETETGGLIFVDVNDYKVV